MRDILFKAKRISDGQWVEGYLYKQVGVKDRIYFAIEVIDNTVKAYEVDESTICQYIGLSDKNGNKIWENDIVKFEDCEMSTDSGYGDCFVNVGKIAYDTDTMSYYITDRITVEMDDIYIKNDVEVIGNIFDNPELLEG